MTPSVSAIRSKTFPFQVAAACWVDLLGYGSMLSEAEFNPLHDMAVAAHKRLTKFHEIVAQHSERRFPTMAINDGAVAYRDLSLRTDAVTYDFVVRCWLLFCALRFAEEEHQYPGVRMVVASGFRARGSRRGIDATASHFGSIMRRVQSGKIDTRQAMHEARRIRPAFDVVPQLQANFAFTKAYTAEQTGARGGLSGPQCFIELSFFAEAKPSWLTFGDRVNWRHPTLNLTANFAPILNAEIPKASGHTPAGFRSGIEVGQLLTGDSDLLAALRALEPIGRVRPREVTGG